MKSIVAVAAILGISLTAGISGYLLGRFTEAKRVQIQDAAAYALASQALEPGLASANPDEVEHALWLTLGNLRAVERTSNRAMPSDIAAMEIAIAYAKLAQMPVTANLQARKGLLMKQAISACQRTTSPNCNVEALTLLAQRLSAPGAPTR